MARKNAAIAHTRKSTGARANRPLPWPAQLALGVGVGALAAGCALAARWARRTDVHACRTASGLALVRTVRDEDGAPVRVLQHGGVFQSATYLNERWCYPPFAYLRAFERAFEAETPTFRIRRALMLGGGGYAWPKWALSRHPELRLDVVELDPAITRIARRFFFLGELMEQAGFESWRLDAAGIMQRLDRRATATARLGLIEGDGRAFVDGIASGSLPMQGTDGSDLPEGFAPGAPAFAFERYDLVVNDTFAGTEPVRSLATVEAARAAKAALTPGALYAANVVSRAEGADVSFLRAVVATLREAFAHVLVIPCADEDFGGEDNYLVLATDRDLEQDGCTSLMADAIPYDEDFPTAPLFD